MTMPVNRLHPAAAVARPRIGFVGLGWIGHHRMKAMTELGLIEVDTIADPSPDMLARAASLTPSAARLASFDELLERDLDGIVIATPTALHAEQSIRALERGIAVFCQKPLGRTAAEVRAVVETARAADRLLAVDLSYRFTEGMRRIHKLIRDGALGHIYAVDLIFHNAYGPDKAWFYDTTLSGGGCVMDLGVHLVDLALWALDFPAVQDVSATLFSGGAPLGGGRAGVEDYAVAELKLVTGADVRLACSWRLHAGRDAVISAAFYGTQGGAELGNVDGSFYDFVAAHCQGTARHIIAAPPDGWFGRAAVDWAERLVAGERFSSEAERLVDVARVLDAIYDNAGTGGSCRLTRAAAVNNDPSQKE